MDEKLMESSFFVNRSCLLTLVSADMTMGVMSPLSVLTATLMSTLWYLCVWCVLCIAWCGCVWRVVWVCMACGVGVYGVWCGCVWCVVWVSMVWVCMACGVYGMWCVWRGVGVYGVWCG